MRLRNLFGAVIVALMVTVGFGCNNSEKGGGAAAGNTFFTLSAPATSTTLKQSESKVIEINVKRDKDFTEDVSLKAEVPKDAGLTVELVQATVKNNTAKVDLKVTAALNAVLGKHNIRVIGTPTKGSATEVTVTVEVEAPPSQK